MIDGDIKYWIYGIYIFSAILWTYMILVLRLFVGPGFFLVFVPYIVFIINIFNYGSLEPEEEQIFFTGTFLSIGLIVMVAILGWFKNMGNASNKDMSILLLSLALALFAHIELGFSTKYITIYRHYRSVLQTFSIVLFLIVLVNYVFIDQKNQIIDRTGILGLNEV